MTTTRPKRVIALTDDNWADYLSFDYPDSLVKGLVIPADGIDPDGTEVDRLIDWVAKRNAKLAKTDYTLSRHDAAVVLNLCAGWDPTATRN